MVKKSYFDVLRYPLATWIIFLVIILAAGFTSYSNIAVQMTLSTGTYFIAILFGLWVGRRSAKAFPYLWVAMLNAVMLSVIAGFVSILFDYILANYSQSFMTYMSQYAAQGQLSTFVLSVGIGNWIEMAMMCIVGAAVAYEFFSKN